jgi:hypothetical protein
MTLIHNKTYQLNTCFDNRTLGLQTDNLMYFLLPENACSHHSFRWKQHGEISNKAVAKIK